MNHFEISGTLLGVDPIRTTPRGARAINFTLSVDAGSAGVFVQRVGCVQREAVDLFIATAQIGQLVECSGRFTPGKLRGSLYLNADSIAVANAGNRRRAFDELDAAGDDADDEADDVAV